MTFATDTAAWSRNPSDTRAASRGHRFNVSRGSQAVWWIERICRLYEGDNAGEPLHLHGCRTCKRFGPAPDEWDAKTEKLYAKRAVKHCACVAAGHDLDWQYECVMRLFSWEHFSGDWKGRIRRFNKGGVFVSKKNKKSPSLAAIALYMFCGDGEPGQKVFLCAKDGKQAKENTGKHVVAMFERSPELDEECVLNKTLTQLTHTTTDSIIKPISSADTKTQKSKEGLNGSSFVDETHVVDAEFIDVISRAGISRREPLHLEFSTAGDDPQSYGFRQFEYGLGILDGSIDDDAYFAMIFAAPQKLTDAELEADPVKWGRMANPAWGHTVKESEYLADYKRSKRSITDLAKFKMYRLNIWQQTSNPWLNMGDWAACGRTLAEAEFYGRECYLALDLGKTRDTSALAAIFPEGDGEYSLLCWHWLPEARAEEMRGKVQYAEWAAAGWLTLTPGDVCDYGFIRAEINRIRKLFDVRKLEYDDCYAAQLIQRLTEEDGLYSDVPEEFAQTIKVFAGPTAAFERLVISGKIHHNNNPLLTWQAGNTRVKPDVNGNVRPVKQTHAGDIRTIDGMVAAIMAIASAHKHGYTGGYGGVEAW